MPAARTRRGLVDDDECMRCMTRAYARRLSIASADMAESGSEALKRRLQKLSML